MIDTHLEIKCLLLQLPLHLKERTYLRSNGISHHHGDFVVYWTHHALRVDENPALDVATTLASTLSVPLIVYLGVSEKTPFASDRHHTFILEAARALETKYQEHGVSFLLHVERESDRAPRLKQIAKNCAVLVTDDFPIGETKVWTDHLAETAQCPIVLVDTACVVPTRMIGRAFERAFEFRDATKSLYRDRVKLMWPECTLKVPAARLPFEGLTLKNQRIANLVAQCDIDHSVGPVADTCGGTDAGYARWQDFRKHKLKHYAKDRNQIEIDGVSRMSAYLHYGMVSPFRLARDASNDGAEKYLEELLIWRELSYAFCYYTADFESDTSLPTWAIESLNKHKSDTRRVLSWETLARAKSGDALWDAAQRSLLKHGELHNNVRMTWGKAIVQWSANHRDAFARLIDLNHRYALDGQDPASYGGILWCLGQFDRPFKPEQPIFGSVRTRQLAGHTSRTDVAAFENRIDRTNFPNKPRIAMIGAGLGGLICCRTLQDHGLSVTCFEKSNRPGGRTATRSSDGIMQFDHGAQYFTIRSLRLKNFLESWLEDRVISPWDGRVVNIHETGSLQEAKETNRYVGIPKMESLGQHLAKDLLIENDTEITMVERIDAKYRLTSKTGRELGEFDLVLWGCPPLQVGKILPEACAWREELTKVKMLPCWAVMVAFDSKWSVDFDGAFINCGGTLSWMARDSSKPSRSHDQDCWILHSSVEWATDHLEVSKEEAIQILTQEAQRVTNSKMPNVTVAKAHRWLFSRPKEALKHKALWDNGSRLGACGDWCGGPRVEGALESGIALAGHVLGSLTTSKGQYYD